MSRWGLPGSGFRGVLVAALCIGLLAFVTARVYPLQRYQTTARRISETLRSVTVRCPADVSPKAWNVGVDWTVTAFVNVCFSESHVTYQEMLRFEADLHARLQQPLDTAYFAWVWDRLADTGAHGRKYVQKCRPLWETQMRATWQTAHGGTAAGAALIAACKNL